MPKTISTLKDYWGGMLLFISFCTWIVVVLGDIQVNLAIVVTKVDTLNERIDKLEEQRHAPR